MAAKCPAVKHSSSASCVVWQVYQRPKKPLLHLKEKKDKMWAVATNFWIWQWLRGAQAVFFVFVFFSHSIKGFHPLGALGGQWANKASAGTRQWFIRERRLGLLFQPLTSEGDGHIICTFPPEREREGRPGRSSQVTASGTWRLPQAEYWGGWHCLRSSQATDAGACCQCHCSCFGVYIKF